MVEIRFHGRGGQGVKIASRILGTGGFLAGLFAQDFALFGAERRGAPVVSFTRLDTTPIERRGYIEVPDLVVVMDDSLLKEAPAQVFTGVQPNSPVVVNSAVRFRTAGADELPQANFIFADLSGMARRVMGRTILSAAAAAVAAKCIPAISVEYLAQAVQIELGEFDLSRDTLAKNEQTAREVYALMPVIALNGRSKAARAIQTADEFLSLPLSPKLVGPTICHPASSAARNTGTWRMERPEIEPAKCKRCFLCYLYCPDAAIRLDQDHLPHIEYHHCKGCLICAQECPTDAITRRVEIECDPYEFEDKAMDHKGVTHNAVESK